MVAGWGVIPFHARLPMLFPWLARACLQAKTPADTERIVARMAAESPPQPTRDAGHYPAAAFAGWVACGSQVIDVTPESVDALLGAEAPDTCPPLEETIVVNLPRHPRLVWEKVGPITGAYLLPADYVLRVGPSGVGRYLFGGDSPNGDGYKASDLWHIEPEHMSKRTDYCDLDRLIWALCCALADKRISAVTEFPRHSIRRQRLQVGGARYIRRLVLTPDALGVWVRTKIGDAVHPASPETRAPVSMHLVHPHLARYWVREAKPADVELDENGRPLTRPGKDGPLVAVRRERVAHVRGSADPTVKRTRLVTE